jgi:hypothetical protein
MPQERDLRVSANRFRFAIVAGVALCAASLIGAPANRIHLFPKFTAGETLRYHIETRMTTSGKMTTPIVNPEAASQLKQSVSLLLRLDVLDAAPAAAGAAGSVRLRATYEKSKATSESDAYDPAAASLEDQYDRLEGRSMEFTIEPDGKISSISGIDDALANPSTAATVRSWMNGLSSGAGFPKEGIEISKKWTSEKPLDGSPLAGLIWRTESTYLRDEPCNATSDPAVASRPAPPPPNLVGPACAVIVTRFEILRHGSAHGDATPPDYLHNGLRTSGTWTGSGESLDAISLVSGMVIRSTQRGTQNMDFEIVSAASGSKLHYVGRVETQSDISLLPPASPQP